MATSGRYEIIRELGHGAMGIVYLGKDPKINREVALKCLRPHILEAHESAGRRFQQEILALGRLIHPNIVTIFDVWEDPVSGSTYIVMEYVEGISLAELLKEKRSLSCSDVVNIGIQICEGLDFAHSREVIHRDIKPGNILLSRDLSVAKITDFGIARLDDLGMTQTDRLTGTPQYMSPEQCRGEHLDGRSDLFAVGVLLYELLTREKAFRGDSITSVMHQVLTQMPYAPYLIDDDIPEGLSAVVMQALEKAPDARFATGLDMADALETTMESASTRTFSLTRTKPGSMDKTETLSTASLDVVADAKGAGFWRYQMLLFPSIVLVSLGALFIFWMKSPSSVTQVPTDAIEVPFEVPSSEDESSSAGKAALKEKKAPEQKKQIKKVSVKPTPIAPKPIKPLPLAEETLHAEPPGVDFEPVMTGEVVFATIPSGAEILINGDLVGFSPVSINLPAGPYELLVSKKGYHALEATIDVPSGEKVPINLQLLEEEAP
ncbi:MAG: protein kinase [Nitrospirae bacterium]|nr:protein kinase [Candidatus Manganitrophaceae bacterium]